MEGPGANLLFGIIFAENCSWKYGQFSLAILRDFLIPPDRNQLDMVLNSNINTLESPLLMLIYIQGIANYNRNHLMFFKITVHNEVAKVMILHLSVRPQGRGGGSASLQTGIPSPLPGSIHRPPRPADGLLLRTVRILLECIP